MSVLVAMAANKPGGYQPIFLRQLREAGVPYMSEYLPNFTWAKRLEWMKLIAQSRSSTHIVFTDAWDMLFFGTKEGLEEEADWMIEPILFGAEKNCFPTPGLAPLYPDYPHPWKYLNAGCFMVRREWLADFLAQFDLSGVKDDQEFWTHRFLYDNIGDLDYECRLVQNLFMWEKGELVGHTRPYNTITDTFPIFIHANGKSSLPPSVEMCLIP